MQTLGRAIGDSRHLIASFSLSMVASIVIPILVYVLVVAVTRRLSSSTLSFRRWFSSLSFSVLPVAFSYHLAHNLSHVARESGGLGEVLTNPLGVDTVPLKMMELHARQANLLFPEQLMYALQAGIMVLGFWLAVEVLRHRGREFLVEGGSLAGWRLVPMLIFLGGASAGNLLLLVQEMAMRL